MLEDILNMLRKKKIEFMDSVRGSIDTSRSREIESLPNGDKFVHDSSAGYVIDGATRQIKEWRVKVGSFGGPSTWAEAEYRWNGVIGPDGGNGLYPKPPMPIRF